MTSVLAASRSRLFLVVPTILGVVVIATIVLVVRANAEPATWPPFTMTYQQVVDEGTAPPLVEVHRLEYQSKDEWTDTVVEAPSVDTRLGAFSNKDSYQRVSGGVYSRFSAATGSIREEKLEQDTIKVPNGFLVPFQKQSLELANIGSTRVTTNSVVCFRDKCIEGAPGLRYAAEGQPETVLADDSRGIPLRSGDDFVVTELLIHDIQR
jgi:hypothetical protein